jgi:two-component SAPR family response regulator
MKTSISETLNPELCDSLLNSRKSNRILSYLASEHIFISKINENYRYHPLFKEFLFKTLKNFSPAWQIRMLYRKAGMHFSKVGDYESAVNCYFLSEDYAKAAKVLEKNCDRLIVSGKFNTFMTLIGHLPAVILNKHSSLLLEKSRALLFMGKWTEALKNLDKLKKYFKRKKDSRRLVEILERIAFIYLVLMQPDKALVYAKRAYKLALNNRNLKAKIMLTFGNIYRVIGEYGKAENFLNSAFKIGDEKIKEQILDALALLYSEKTEFKKALECFSSLLTKEDPNNPDLRFAARYANAAALFIEVHNFTKAKEFLVRAMNLARRFNDQRTMIYAIGIERKLYLYQGNYQKAIDCYQRAIELNSQELKERKLELYARIDLAYAYLGKKEISKAKSELKMVTDLLPPSAPPHILIDFWLIKGKMNIIDGDLNSAEKDLIQALRIAEESQQPFSKMVVFYELAKFYIDNNDKEKSFRFSRDCIEIASENNYDFFLIRKGKDDLSFFEFALKENINKDYLLSILQKIGTKETNQLCREIESKYDLEIQLFGNLIIKNNDGKILAPDWKTRKAKSLFIYLILNQGKSIQKDSLIETFWKEKGLKEAQHNLHDHIFFIRKILKEILPNEIDVKKIIKYQSQFYTLSDEIKLKTDAIEFEKLIARASAMESSTKEKAIELYKQAFELYKNDFCPELYEDWAEEKRLYYRNKALKIAKRLGEHYYQNKDYDGSLSFYKRALQFDHCDEAIHLGIIKCLVALGDKIGARRQYNEMEQILKKELDLSPSSETLKVYQELINSLN